MAERPSVPVVLRCRWHHTGGSRYECPDCGQWTANLPRYKNDLCPAKERRKGQKERRHA